MPAFLTASSIDAGGLTMEVMEAVHGGVVTFVGAVRDRHNGCRVVALQYSAYDSMAEEVAGQILAEAQHRWHVTVAARHRVGELRVGEVAVAIAVSAAHRDAAFDACRWIIDAIKSRVPIWKREQYIDGRVAWVDPTAPADVAGGC